MTVTYCDAMDNLRTGAAERDALVAFLMVANETDAADVVASEAPLALAPLPVAARSDRAPRAGRALSRRAAVALTAGAGMLLAGFAWAASHRSVRDTANDLFPGESADLRAPQRPPFYDPELLATIGTPMGISCTSAGLTMTLDALIGDAENFVAVYTLEMPGRSLDKPLPSGELPTYQLMGMQSDNLANNSVRIAGENSGSSFYDAVPHDGAVQLAEFHTTVPTEGSIIGGHVSNTFFGLWSFEPDIFAEPNEVADGTWNFDYDLCYHDTARLFASDGEVLLDDGTPAHITAASVSAVAVTVDYEVRTADKPDLLQGRQHSVAVGPDTMTTAPDGDYDRYLGALYACAQLNRLEVELDDGTTLIERIGIDGIGGGGSSGEDELGPASRLAVGELLGDDPALPFHRAYFLEKLVDPSRVVAVTVGGTRFPVNDELAEEVSRARVLGMEHSAEDAPLVVTEAFYRSLQEVEVSSDGGSLSTANYFISSVLLLNNGSEPLGNLVISYETYDAAGSVVDHKDYEFSPILELQPGRYAKAGLYCFAEEAVSVAVTSYRCTTAHGTAYEADFENTPVTSLA